MYKWTCSVVIQRIQQQFDKSEDSVSVLNHAARSCKNGSKSLKDEGNRCNSRKKRYGFQSGLPLYHYNVHKVALVNL